MPCVTPTDFTPPGPPSPAPYAGTRRVEPGYRGRVPRSLRLAAAVAACAAFAALAAAGAGAHGEPPVPSTHFLSTVQGITPPLPGLKVRIPGRQDPLVLTNATGRTVVVQGYSGEPYLRFDAKGVWMNMRSPSRWLDAPGWEVDSPLPKGADPKAPPVWKLLTVGHVWSWHDTRVQWRGGFPAQIVPRGATSFPARDWEIGLEVDGKLHILRGTLTYFPKAQPSRRPAD